MMSSLEAVDGRSPWNLDVLRGVRGETGAGLDEIAAVSVESRLLLRGGTTCGRRRSVTADENSDEQRRDRDENRKSEALHGNHLKPNGEYVQVIIFRHSSNARLHLGT